MMKHLILVVMVAILLVTGCAGGVKTYTDSTQTINTGTNQEFIIALDSNPTTGYSWQVSFDTTALELIEQTYELGEYAKEGIVGAGGTELFRFKALKSGDFQITFDYQRPWEDESIDQMIFTVEVN